MNELKTLEADAEALWIAEIGRWDDDLRSGNATAKPAEEVLREALERLQQT